MNLKTIWATIGPGAIKELVAREPAISAWIGAGLITVATHYGLHLDLAQQLWVTGGVTGLLNWLVRQVVIPISSAALGDQPGIIKGAEVEITPPTITPVKQPPTPRKSRKREARKNG